MDEPAEPKNQEDLDRRLQEVRERYLRETNGQQWDWAEVIRAMREERSQQQMEILYPHGIPTADQTEQERTMSAKETIISTHDIEGHVEDIVRRVGEGEAIVVERGGEPSVAIISIEEYRRLKERQEQLIDSAEGDEPEWYRMAKESGRRYAEDLKGRKIDWDQVIREMREERDEQILDSLR